MEQEQWVPLLEIFLKSPSPVGEASHWLHNLPRRQSHKGKGKGKGPPDLWKFVAHLLAKNVVYFDDDDEEEEKEGEEIEQDTHQHTTCSKSTSGIGRCMWIETLPSAMQSNILTFLSVEHTYCRKKDLQVLAQTLLAKPDLDFWVRRAVENLFSTVVGNNASPLFIVDKNPEMDDYNALPEWLHDCRRPSDSLFPWIPLASKSTQISANDVLKSSEEGRICQAKKKREEKPQHSGNVMPEKRLRSSQVSEAAGERTEDLKHAEDYASEIQHATSCISVEAEVYEAMSSIDVEMVDREGTDSKSSLDPQAYAQATSLKEGLLSVDSSSCVSSIAENIYALCSTADSREVLSIIKPWEVDDEVTLQLVETLLKEQEGYAWSTDMLCSLVLPKLLCLREPASRIFVTAVVQASKVHQRATVDALLLPLMFYKEGLNVAVCEVLHRITKDCLQADHVSSFFQKLQCEANQRQCVTCLPCHQSELSPFLIWTEPVFTLFQNILNQQMPLTQEAIDVLVLALDDLAEQFSKSLKFGNFLLCLVSKYASLLKHHKSFLQRVAERTNTFITKSILTKLNCF